MRARTRACILNFYRYRARRECKSSNSINEAVLKTICRKSYAHAAGWRQSPNGYVSGIPLPCPEGSAATALVRSNQVHASNCMGSDDAE